MEQSRGFGKTWMAQLPDLKMGAKFVSEERLPISPKIYMPCSAPCRDRRSLSEKISKPVGLPYELTKNI
ncbi:MAG: hypothetical protein NZ937_07910 [Armatimonadetes bacterium]|nr:hypothetical protein [Armatimonadota bacterium]